MRFDYTKRFKKQYRRLPADIRTRADKQLAFLRENQRHPSLRLKKMAGNKNRWEVSITMRYRVTLAVVSNTYMLLNVGTHDIVDKK